MSAQNETLTLNQAQVVPVESVVSFVDEKSMDVVVENQLETQSENQPKTKKELKMTKKTKKLIVLCGKLYGFDGEDAITRLLNHEKPKKEKKAKEPRKRKSVASNPEDGEKKKRGRPAKTVKVVEESQVVDMFADIVSKDDVAPEEEEHVETPFETPVETKKVKKSKVLSEEEKAEKEAKKAQEKADKEAKKAQEKADKEAKKAQEKADKEAKKAEEKALKEAEKEAKKTEKPAKKSKAKTEKKAPESVESTPSVSDNESETEQEVFKVKKFEHKGVSYLRTRNGDNWHENGHIYNMVQDLVGFWNELNQDIQFVEEGECEEEEYDA